MKARGKTALADVICYCKMASVMALDGVTSLLRLKDVTSASKLCETVQLLAGVIQCNGGKFKEAEDFKCVFVVLFFVRIEVDQLLCVNC